MIYFNKKSAVMNMLYNKKPKMILFDVGGTLFDDGKCNPLEGFEKLRLSAVNPEITSRSELAKNWDKYLDEVSEIKSKSGITLDIPLSCVIRFATLNTGLIFDFPMAEQEEIFDRFNSSRRVIDGIPELLAELDSCGIRTAVISNNMMSGESLLLAIKKWIPSSKFEFCLTSADILFTKPSKNIFVSALKHAQLDASECWYCGDGEIPDVYGASACGITPVLLDMKASTPLEFRSDINSGKYLAVKNWNELNDYIKNELK